MKTPTWDELEEAVNRDDGCLDFLEKTPERYRKAVALALALARWRPERKHGRRGEGGSGICAYEFIVTGFYDCSCPSCLLKSSGEWCHSPDSLYKKWVTARKQPLTMCTAAERNEAADAMYNFLCKMYREEYNRC